MRNLYWEPGMHTEDHGDVAGADEVLVQVSHGLGRQGVKVSSPGCCVISTALNTHPVNIVLTILIPVLARSLGTTV